jgi:hypothetical protein
MTKASRLASSGLRRHVNLRRAREPERLGGRADRQ